MSSFPAGFFRPVIVPEGPPRLAVVVDTEEEFDWNAPFSRDAVAVTAIDEVDRLQDVLEAHGVRPTYVVDHPIAATARSADRLSAIARRGACDIGAHLHPWVNPPFVETVSVTHSYACRLPAELEREKLATLRATIEQGMGVTPRVYKAGRYGFAPQSATTLEALGFDVDVSINPNWDFSADGGPSHEDCPVTPGWFGSSRALLEWPCTTAYAGLLRRWGGPLHRLASRRPLAGLRAVGILARAGLVNKVMLSPEGHSLDEMRQLTEALLADGVRTFALTLHSPSVKPGCTPYVRDTRDRDALLTTIDRYCEDFLGRLGGTATTPAALFDALTAGNQA